MGFFKSIGKALTAPVKAAVNSVSGLTKMVSIKNVVGLATGTKGLGSLAQEAAGRVIEGTVKAVGGMPAPSEVVTVEVGGRPVEMTTGNAAVAIENGSAVASTTKGIGFKEVANGALSGAMIGAGKALAGDKNVQSAGEKVGMAFIWEWIKQHVWYVVGGAVVLALGIWAMFFRGKKRKRNWR